MIHAGRPRLGRRPLLGLLALALLGLHAAHLPMLVGGHAASPTSAADADRGHGPGRWHRPAADAPEHARSVSACGSPTATSDALRSAAAEMSCLAETVAALPRTLGMPLLVVGQAVALVVDALTHGTRRSRPLPPIPAAWRRRALLRVYLI